MFVCLSVSRYVEGLTICLSVFPSVCWSVGLSVDPAVGQLVCKSIGLAECPSIGLSVCPTHTQLACMKFGAGSFKPWAALSARFAAGLM